LNKSKINNAYFYLLLTAAVLFCLISILVVSGKTIYIDNLILLSFRNAANTSIPIGPYWLLDFMRDVSALGSVSVAIVITVIASGFLIIKKGYKTLNILLSAVLGGGMFDLLLKEVFTRPRPRVVPHLVNVDSLSYPSGHSVMSAAIYLTLALILINLDIKRNIKMFFLYSAIFLILIIGISRIYLGVHYPSDVLGGWDLGLIWSSFSVMFLRKKNG
jgi:undecaprenyl-diphosphatase